VLYEPIGCVDKEGLLPDSTRHKRGLLGWRVTPLMYGGETSVGKCILGDSLEKPRSDLLAHTPEVCKVPSGAGNREDHDSWVKCTNSAECQTEYSAVLTVMSSLDPRMISRGGCFSWSGNWVEFPEVKENLWSIFSRLK
jgi:hypothetical protein